MSRSNVLENRTDSIPEHRRVGPQDMPLSIEEVALTSGDVERFFPGYRIISISSERIPAESSSVETCVGIMPGRQLALKMSISKNLARLAIVVLLQWRPFRSQ